MYVCTVPVLRLSRQRWWSLPRFHSRCLLRQNPVQSRREDSRHAPWTPPRTVVPGSRCSPWARHQHYRPEGPPWFYPGTGEVFVANVTNVQRHLVGLHFAFLLLAGRRVFPQLDLARKHGFAELALEYRARLFFLFVRAAHLLHVLAQVGQPTKRVLAVFTLERPLVLVSCSHVHRKGRVVSKCSTTTTQWKQDTVFIVSWTPTMFYN